MVFTVFREKSPVAAQSGPRAPKGGPGEAQEAPRTVQERSGEAQGRPKRAPRATQSGPRGSWERPRTTQGRPWRGREGPGSGPGAAQGTRRRPERLPGCENLRFLSLTDVFEGVDAPKTHHLQGFSHRASIIVEPSRRPCRGSRAARYTDENTVRNHWSKGLSRQLRDRCALASVH
jgi:hypothetical protein